MDWVSRQSLCRVVGNVCSAGEVVSTTNSIYQLVDWVSRQTPSRVMSNVCSTGEVLSESLEILSIIICVDKRNSPSLPGFHITLCSALMQCPLPCSQKGHILLLVGPLKFQGVKLMQTIHLRLLQFLTHTHNLSSPRQRQNRAKR